MNILFFDSTSPVRRHWRGEYSLFITSLVFLLLLRLLHYSFQSSFDQPLSGFVFFFCLASNLALLAWQIAGSLRAIDHSMSFSGDMVAVYLCYLCATLVFVVSLLQVGDSLSSLNPPAPTENVVLAAPVQLPLSADGQTVLVQGFLDFNTSSKLQTTIASNPQVKTLLLTSEGGRVFAARAMSIAVERAGLDTRIDGNCFSACALLFMAGKQRSMGRESQLGFHRYSMSATQPGQVLSIEAELEKDRAYFLSRGVHANFVLHMFDRQSDEIWRPTRIELEQAGILTSTI